MNAPLTTVIKTNTPFASNPRPTGRQEVLLAQNTQLGCPVPKAFWLEADSGVLERILALPTTPIRPLSVPWGHGSSHLAKAASRWPPSDCAWEFFGLGLASSRMGLHLGHSHGPF